MSSAIYSLSLLGAMTLFIGYMALQTKYPGKGLKPMKNAMKETMTFEKAIQALQEGHRIRRKSESQGFTKIVITEGKTKNEKHGTYWTHNPSSISNYCSFEVKDVIATDWIIDDE